MCRRRQGVQLPKRPPVESLPALKPIQSWIGAARSGNVFVPGNSCMNSSRYPHMNGPTWNNHINTPEDPSLWLVREEERVGFEAEYKLSDGQSTDRCSSVSCTTLDQSWPSLCLGKPTGHDVIESFAIVVPSTRYPPAIAPQFVPQFLSSCHNQLDVSASI